MPNTPEKQGKSGSSSQDVLDAMRATSKSAQDAIEAAKKTGSKADETKELQSTQIERSENALKETAGVDEMIRKLTLSAAKLTLANGTKMDEFIEKAKFHLNYRLDEFKDTKDAVKASVANDPQKVKLVDDIDSFLKIAYEHYATAQKEWAANPENVDEDILADQWSRMMGAMKSMERNLNAYDKLRNDYRYFARSFETAAKRYSRPQRPLNTRDPKSRLEWEDHESFKKKMDEEISAMWKDREEFLKQNPDPSRDTPRIAELRVQMDDAIRLFNEHQPKWSESQDDRNIVMMSVYMLQGALFEYMHVDQKLLEGGADDTPDAQRRKAEQEQKAADVAEAERKVDEEQKQTQPVQSRDTTPAKPPAATAKQQPTLAPPLQPKNEPMLAPPLEAMPSTTPAVAEQDLSEEAIFAAMEKMNGFSKALVVNSNGFPVYYFSEKHPAFKAMLGHETEMRPVWLSLKGAALGWKDWQTLGGAEDGSWRPVPTLKDAVTPLERGPIRANVAMPAMPSVDITINPPKPEAVAPTRATIPETPTPMETVKRDAQRKAVTLGVPKTEKINITEEELRLGEEEIARRGLLPKPAPASAMKKPAPAPTRDTESPKAMPKTPDATAPSVEKRESLASKEGLIDIPGKEIYVAFYLPDGTRSMDFVKLGSRAEIAEMNVTGRFSAVRTDGGWAIRPEKGLMGTFLIRADGKDRQVRVRRP